MREINSKDKITAAEKKTLAAQRNILRETPINIRSNALFSQEDFELLRTINEELKANK